MLKILYKNLLIYIKYKTKERIDFKMGQIVQCVKI